jgi:hypothetical protein
MSKSKTIEETYKKMSQDTKELRVGFKDNSKRIMYLAKELTQKGIVLNCSESLLYFMNNKIELDTFDNETLDKFANLDDFDIISALKSWINNEDFILSNLSKMIINWQRVL